MQILHFLAALCGDYIIVFPPSAEGRCKYCISPHHWGGMKILHINPALWGGEKTGVGDGGGGVLGHGGGAPGGVRGPRRTRCRAAGPLAPSLGLHSRRKMTSLNRRAPRSPHTPDAIGSVLLRCYVCLVGLRGVCLRGLCVFGVLCHSFIELFSTGSKKGLQGRIVSLFSPVPIIQIVPLCSLLLLFAAVAPGTQ